MASINISLPDSLLAFLKEQVKKYGYSTASEYVRDLLRAARERKTNERLDQLLLEGLESGPATEMTAEDWKDIHKELDQFIVQNKKRS